MQNQLMRNLSKNQKIALVSILVIGIVVAVFSVVFMIFYTPRIVVIQNLDQYMESATRDEKIVLQRNLYLFLVRSFGEEVDPEDIYIREKTYKQVFEGGRNVADFIIDIDSLKISYEMSFAFPLEGLTSQNPVVNCPELSKMKYPDTYCVGMYNSTNSLKAKQKNPVDEILPIVVEKTDPVTGAPIHYDIRGFFDESDDYKFVINITDYTRGNQENALNMIREKGFNPDDYTIVYRDVSVFNYLPREAENSLGDKFTIDYTYTLEGAPYFLINNYSCIKDRYRSEESTVAAVSDWFSSLGNSLSNYQYGILTFCVVP